MHTSLPPSLPWILAQIHRSRPYGQPLSTENTKKIPATVHAPADKKKITEQEHIPDATVITDKILKSWTDISTFPVGYPIGSTHHVRY